MHTFHMRKETTAPKMSRGKPGSTAHQMPFPAIHLINNHETKENEHGWTRMAQQCYKSTCWLYTIHIVLTLVIRTDGQNKLTKTSHLQYR